MASDSNGLTLTSMLMTLAALMILILGVVVIRRRMGRETKGARPGPV